jgi:hypothetical protein
VVAIKARVEVDVEMLVGAPKPDAGYLRDWHVVPRDEFLPPVQAALGRSLSPEKANLRFQELQL